MMEQSGRAIKKNRGTCSDALRLELSSSPNHVTTDSADQADIDAEQALQKEQEALENQRAMQEQKAPYK